MAFTRFAKLFNTVEYYKWFSLFEDRLWQRNREQELFFTRDS